ncbi:MAG: NUDIX domain-containing protein [Patescibacteria group bacterium]|nr:NUDIX domain-containing protein [Patescibacteria group bacterium]
MEKIIVVDKKDNVMGAKERNLITKEDIYRVSALWIINSKNETLLARRAFDKKHDPGKWGPAVAGTVEEGETYETNIKKEAFEELGIRNTSFIKCPKSFVDGEWRFFGQKFIAKLDWNLNQFKFQKEEVAEIGWFPIDQLEKDLVENPDEFVPSLPKSFLAVRGIIKKYI